MPRQQVPNSVNLPTFTSGGATFDEPLWDRIGLDSTQAKRELFTVGVGEQDPISGVRKTEADTNQRSQGMSKSSAFTVFGIGFKYMAIEARTVAELVMRNDVLRNTTFEFFIDDKSQYGRCTLDYIVGDPMPTVLTLAAADNYAYNSLGVIKGYWPLNETIPLSNLVDYHIGLEHYAGTPDAALDGDYLKFELIGLKGRKAIS